MIKKNEKGGILLESIISISLIFILILPILNFINLYFKLEKNKINTKELNELDDLKLWLGEKKQLTSFVGKNKIGYFSNIGIEKYHGKEEFAYYELNKGNFIYIETKISQYTQCQ